MRTVGFELVPWFKGLLCIGLFALMSAPLAVSTQRDAQQMF